MILLFQQKLYKKVARFLGIVFTLCAVLLIDTSPTAFAHPAPSVIHDYVVSLKPHALTVLSYLRVSPELVPEVYRLVDIDGDGKTSEVERQAWLREHPSKLAITLDDVATTPSMSPAPGMEQADFLLSTGRPITVTYTVNLSPPVSGKHRIKLTYGDNYLSYDEYYISVAGDMANDGQSVGVSRAKYPATYQIVYQMPESGAVGNLPTGDLAPAPWTLGATQSQGNSTSPAVAPTTPSSSGPVLDMLRTWKGEVWTGLTMLLLALGLGAAHALTPGHGKTMVAAYLIGSRGRVRDAVMLGGVVTLTHTAGVIALGFLLLLIPLPLALQPGLQLLSGALVFGLGVYLLWKRWIDLGAVRALSSTASHGIGAVAQSRSTLTGRSAVAAPSAPATGSLASNVNVQAMEHDGPGPHSHTHPVNQSPDNSQNQHGSDYSHEHDGHAHTHGPNARPENMRAMIGLGISGGLVPCPDALAILLLAVSAGQFTLGLGLVVSFSVGLAIVLIVIGIVLVKMKGVLERGRAAQLSSNPLWTKWVPLGSAAVVIIIGVIMIINSLASRWS